MWSWRILGLISFAFGAIGLFLPLLPTTPFLLLAAYCFSKSSKRLHAWLLASPALGTLIADWEEHRAIRRGAKWASTVLLLAAVSWPIADGRVRGPALVAVVLTVTGVVSFVWTRPDHPLHDRRRDPRSPSPRAPSPRAEPRAATRTARAETALSEPRRACPTVDPARRAP